MSPRVDGHVAPGLEPVREAFADVLAGGSERGAAVAVWHAGALVVDLWGGLAREDGAGAWKQETTVHAYSVVKPVVAAAALVLVARGRLDLDGRVAELWPELAARGKEGTTVRHVLAHQAGLPALRAPVPLVDWPAVCSALAAAEPWWPPGTAHGEHALTYGHLVGEIVRRADGRSLGRFLGDELARPLGLELAVGLDPAAQARAADVVDPSGTWAETLLAGRGALFRRALGVPPDALDPAVVNGAAWRAAEVPAVNGHATARAVARFYGLLLGGGVLDGVRIFDPGVVRELLAPQATARDLVLEEDVTWGLGPQLEGPEIGLGGIGGSLGYAHREAGFAFAYLTRTLGGHERAEAVAAAVEDALGR